MIFLQTLHANLVLDSFLDLGLGLSNGLLNILLRALKDLACGLLRGLPHGNTGKLDNADDCKEEVDGGKTILLCQHLIRLVTVVTSLEEVIVQHILGADYEAPAGPDETGAGEGEVLGEGELLSGTGKVRDTGEDESPLCSSQYVHSLQVSCRSVCSRKASSTNLHDRSPNQSTLANSSAHSLSFSRRGRHTRSAQS